MDIEFLAGLSHELKTPLNSLLILLRQLSENPEGNLTEQQIEFAKTIYSCGGDLEELINHIFDLSKIKKKVITADFQPVSIKDTAAYINSIFEPIATSKNIPYQTELQNEIRKGISFENELKLNNQEKVHLGQKHQRYFRGKPKTDFVHGTGT